MDDGKIVDLYWERSEAAISETAQKYEKPLHKLAVNIVLDDESAEECVNDTYLKAWNAMPPHRPEYLFAFLAKITRRLAFGVLDSRRAQKRNAVVVALQSELMECIPAPSDTEAQYDGERLSELIGSFLSGLSYEKRNMFLRRYWFADSVTDIAARFSVSESKVKSALFRVRNELKEQLLKEGICL